MQKVYKVIDLDSQEIEVFDFKANEGMVRYRKLTPNEEWYQILVIDAQTRAVVHSEPLKLGPGTYYHTHWPFSFTSLITNDIFVRFYKNDKLVFNKKFQVHQTDNFNVLTDFRFNEDQFMGTLVEVYGQNFYIEKDLGVAVEKDDIVVDIGANTGAFIMLALERGAKKVYACEPNPSCIKVLQSYFDEDDRVEINNIAICDKNDDVELLTSKLHGGSDMTTSVHNKLTIAKRFEDDEKFYNVAASNFCGKIQVKGKTFKNFVLENKIDYIDFLKIDAEGSEVFITVEENEDYFKYQVKKVGLEAHGEDHKRILSSYFEKIGYQVKTDGSALWALNKINFNDRKL